MSQKQTELPVIDRMENLLIWSFEHVARFPRTHRYSIGIRLETQLTAILDQLVRAKFTKQRTTLLQQVNHELAVLRYHSRVAWRLKCLNTDSFGHAAQQLFEIGAMVGGWLKSSDPKGASVS